MMDERIDKDRPCILACGYRKIKSSKSGLEFPTFLVALGQGEPVWRSKRDFLLIGRASSSYKQLPRAALKKLAEKSPWKCPNVELAIYDTCANKFDPYMKKSICQLDQFLQEINKRHQEDDKVQEAWGVFCRPSDTEELIPAISAAAEQIRGDCKIKIEPAAKSPSTSQVESSRLGQYFCSAENAKLMVDIVLESIQPYLESNIRFVEPSCGHGDIVTALINELERRSLLSENISMHGLDIDPNAIQTCRKLNFSSKCNIEWTCQNFLQSSSPKHDKPSITVCLGGPPYTSGVGSQSKVKRDLPDLFVAHCLKEWDAHIVCFLLPARYRETPVVVPTGFDSKTFELNSSTFYFQGISKVTQPSIIQCFTRES
jgi:hypothetical protein